MEDDIESINKKSEDYHKSKGENKILELKISCFRKDNGSPLISTSYEEDESISKKDIAMLIMEMENQKSILLKNWTPDISTYEEIE